MEDEIPTDQKSSSKWFRIAGIAFAALTFLGYAGILFFLFYRVEKIGNELHWTRYNSLFTAVQTIVLAAAGFVFGREVNRSRAERAENEKNTSLANEKDALAKAKEEEMKGKSLAQHILNKIEKPPTSPDQMQIRGLSKGQESNEFIDLASLAQKIYPDINP